jgi:hypothetical protein
VSAPDPCPLCSSPAETTVAVCESCFRRADVELRPEISVAATGEFAALHPETAAALLERSVSPPSAAAAAAEARCTWCGKAASEVKKLLSNQAAHICNECVGFCAEILATELGDDWR